MTKEEQEELALMREEINRLLDRYEELSVKEMVNRKIIEKADELHGKIGRASCRERV